LTFSASSLRTATVPFSRVHDRCQAVTVHSFRVRTIVEQKLDCLDVPTYTGRHECRDSVDTRGCVGILEQGAHAIRLALAGRQPQGYRNCYSVHLGAIIDQKLTILLCPMILASMSAVMPSLSLRHINSFLHEELANIQMPLPTLPE
jgi:hypothetical protein